MPTGYTFDLKRRNFNVKEWLEVEVIKYFGVFISLREEDTKPYTREDLLDYLKSNLSEDKEQVLKIKKYQDQLDEYKKYTSVQWKDLSKQHEQQNKSMRSSIEHVASRIEEFDLERQNYLKSLTNINKLIEANKSKDLQNIFIFARDQIKSTLNFDYSKSAKSYITQGLVEQEPIPWQKFKQNTLENLRGNLRYLQESYKKTQKRNLKRYNYYLKLLKFLDSFYS